MTNYNELSMGLFNNKHEQLQEERIQPLRVKLKSFSTIGMQCLQGHGGEDCGQLHLWPSLRLLISMESLGSSRHQ